MASRSWMGKHSKGHNTLTSVDPRFTNTDIGNRDLITTSTIHITCTSRGSHRQAYDRTLFSTQFFYATVLVSFVCVRCPPEWILERSDGRSFPFACPHVLLFFCAPRFVWFFHHPASHVCFRICFLYFCAVFPGFCFIPFFLIAISCLLPLI